MSYTIYTAAEARTDTLASLNYENVLYENLFAKIKIAAENGLFSLNVDVETDIDMARKMATTLVTYGYECVVNSEMAIIKHHTLVINWKK